jgi:hypothetical protein
VIEQHRSTMIRKRLYQPRLQLGASGRLPQSLSRDGKISLHRAIELRPARQTVPRKDGAVAERLRPSQSCGTSISVSSMPRIDTTLLP